MDITKTATELAKLVKENNLGSITVRDGEKEISIESKRDMPVPVPNVSFPAFPAFTQDAPPAVANSQTEDNEPQIVGNYITSPIVGTFYTSPSPGEAPFVKVGDTVKKGQTVCIIESMKLMNEIASDFDGTVSAILVMDGDAVDFGKELIRIS